MSQPLVSIIIPAYNAGKCIARTIEGVMNQTLSDWELIIVDDGSTDETANLCDGFAADDTRIRVVHKCNGGVSAARNTGLDKTRGQYVTFVDADDYIVPQYLEALMSGIADAKLSVFPFKAVGSEAEVPTAFESFSAESQQFALQDGYPLMVAKNMLHSPYCKLFDNDVITSYGLRFDESVALGEDLLFNLAYLEHVSRVAIGSNEIYYYIRENSHLSRDIRADYAELQLRFFEVKIAFCQRHGIAYDSKADRFGILYDAFASVAKATNIGKGEKLCSLKKLKKTKLVHDYLQQNKAQSVKEFMFRLMLRVPIPLLKFFI